MSRPNFAVFFGVYRYFIKVSVIKQRLKREALVAFEARIDETTNNLLVPWYAPSGQISALRVFSRQMDERGRHRIQSALRRFKYSGYVNVLIIQCSMIRMYMRIGKNDLYIC